MTGRMARSYRSNPASIEAARARCSASTYAPVTASVAPWPASRETAYAASPSSATPALGPGRHDDLRDLRDLRDLVVVHLLGRRAGGQRPRRDPAQPAV